MPPDKKVTVVTEMYICQGMARLVAVYDGSSNLLMRLEYADDFMPVAITRGGSKYFWPTTRWSFESSLQFNGNVIKQIEYDSFGNVIDDSNPEFEPQ